MEPDITLEQAQLAAAKSKHARVTKDSITARIADTHYYQYGTLIVCIIIMQNNFKVTGQAAPADERNFVRAIGERYAYEDAFKKLWQLEGYLLCEFLHRAETPQETQSMPEAEQSLTDIYPLPTIMDVDFTEVYGVAKLPVWKSHKLVFAARIMEQGTLHGSPERIEDDSFQTWRLENGGSVSVSKSLYARVPGGVAVGGFFVRYDDGYESWSPAAAFEGGYTRIG